MTSRTFKWAALAGFSAAAIGGVWGIDHKVAAQQPGQCTQVFTCPQDGGTMLFCQSGGGSGGRGGAGGSGGGGRGGSSAGGRGGSSGAGRGGSDAGVPSGGIVIESALKLDKTKVEVGETLNGDVTYGNTSNAPITLMEIRIAARAPGATHEGGPFTDLEPVMTNVTIPAKGSVKVSASRRFTTADTLGRWEAYPTYQDDSGWHDGPSIFFNVVTASGSGGAGSGATGGGGRGGSGGSGGGPSPSGKMSVGTQEWFIAGWAGTNIWKSGINWGTAYSSGENVWNPQFITDLSGFTVFRHMDTNAVNWSKISKWSQRRLPTDPGNQEIYIDGSSSPDTTGMAIEWQVDMCNRANIDCWFTHPYQADDDYLRQEATLIKNKLNANLKVYIELSNEVWNGSFSAFQQSIDAGKKLGLPGGNEYYQGIAHEMFRSLAMAQIYQDVFGANSMGTRVIRVFAESGNLDLTTEALKNVYGSSQWNPSRQKFDMIALAPYIGNGTNGASETLSRWKSEVDQKVNGEPITYALNNHVKGYNIPLLGCYEAGMHHLQNADAFARNPIAYDAYVYMLDRFATKMNAPCSLYTLHGTWEPKGAWGLFNNVGQAVTEAPKARGTKDWMSRTVMTTDAVWTVIVLLVFLCIIALLVMRMSASRL